MRHLDLFSGIGGFALAAQTVWQDEYEPVAFCEIDKFCQKVLKKHWPDVPIYKFVSIHAPVKGATAGGFIGRDSVQRIAGYIGTAQESE